MSDIRERWESVEELIRAAVEARQAEMWTALPGIVQSVDFEKQTMTVQPAVKSVVKKPDGTVSNVELPVLQDVPIHFPSGGGVTMTMPIKAGDETLLVFSSRPIDAWHQQGGVQQQVDARMHHLADGYGLVGFRSQPRALSNVSSESTQIRSDDGKHIVDLHPQNGIKVSVDDGKHVINVDKTTGISNNSTLKIAHNAPEFSFGGQGGGEVSATYKGTLNITGDLIVNGIRFSTHVHGGVVPGGSDTDKPAG